MNSCKDDLPDFNGTLNVVVPENVADSVFVGEEISFDVAIRAASGLARVEVKQAAHPFEAIGGLEQEGFEAGTDFTYTFNYLADQHQPGEVLDWVIVAFDHNGLSKAVPYTLRVVSRPVRTTIIMPGSIPSIVVAGEQLEFDVLVDAPDGLQKIETLHNGQVLDHLTKTSFDDAFSDNYIFSYLTTSDDGGINTFEIVVTDGYGNNRIASFVVDVTGAVRLVTTYNDVRLGAQNNTNYGQFLDVDAGTIYRISEAKQNSALIDLVSFHSNNTGVVLAAPSNGNAAQFVYNATYSSSDHLATWPTRHATQLKLVPVDGSVNAGNFDDIVDEGPVLAAFAEGGGATSSISPLQLGDVVAFRTVTNKTGVLIVRKRTNNVSDYWDVDIKIQR